MKNPRPRTPTDSAMELADLPGEIRYRLAAHTRAPVDLQQVAAEIQSVLDAITTDSSEDDLRAVATRLRAQVDLGLRILTTIATFAGELEGLGLAARWRGLAEPPGSEI